MMWSHVDDISWWWFLVMPLGMLGFWAAMISIIVTVARRDVPDRGGGPDVKAG
jgi:hypothetical protein